jgi:hypothetical protein
MSMADLLAEVEALGGTVDLEAIEPKLIVDVPDDFPASVVERLRANKRAIIRHLSPSTVLNDTKHLRELWANACLSLAESSDWEPVEFKSGHRVVAGQYGWRLFCAKANLTMLRDQVFPALVRELRPDEPPDELST